MPSLRQRLLLVAGWVVAAVATGLVSAGAVTVAGGQVTDRPLRPLSAAEVAALPVTIEDTKVTSEPLASGGSASLATDLEPESDSGLDAPGDVAAWPAEKEHLPAADFVILASDSIAPSEHLPPEDLIVRVPEVAATSDPTGDGRFPENVEIPPTGPRPVEPEVIELVGGRVSISVVEGGIILNAATPTAGFVVDLLFDRTDELTVTFWNGAHLSTLIATVVDGDLVLAPTENGE